MSDPTPRDDLAEISQRAEVGRATTTLPTDDYFALHAAASELESAVTRITELEEDEAEQYDDRVRNRDRAMQILADSEAARLRAEAELVTCKETLERLVESVQACFPPSAEYIAQCDPDDPFVLFAERLVGARAFVEGT